LQFVHHVHDDGGGCFIEKMKVDHIKEEQIIASLFCDCNSFVM
jgi:hypothetical protein